MSIRNLVLMRLRYGQTFLLNTLFLSLMYVMSPSSSLSRLRENLLRLSWLSVDDERSMFEKEKEMVSSAEHREERKRQGKKMNERMCMRSCVHACRSHEIEIEKVEGKARSRRCLIATEIRE